MEAEKDLSVLEDSLDVCQHCALAAKVANSILSCINERVKGMIFCNISSHYCHWFGAPSSTRTILTHATESIKRPLKQSGTGEHDAHEEADRAGYFQLREKETLLLLTTT